MECRRRRPRRPPLLPPPQQPLLEPAEEQQQPSSTSSSDEESMELDFWTVVICTGLRPSVKIRIASSSVLVLTTYSAASCNMHRKHTRLLFNLFVFMFIHFIKWLLIQRPTARSTYGRIVDVRIYTCKVRIMQRRHHHGDGYVCTQGRLVGVHE